MAMKALICPQCTAQLEPTEQDMERGYAICPACGTTIQFSEVQKVDIHQTVEHIGTVDIINTTQAKNRLLMANRAFDAEIYADAYREYGEVLVNIPDDITALYRRGLCAVYMSGLNNPGLNDLRDSELDTAIKAANNIWNQKWEDAGVGSETSRQARDELQQVGDQMWADMTAMLHTLLNEYSLKYDSLADLASCKTVEHRYVSLTFLYSSVTLLAPTNYKTEEAILKEGIALCDQAKKLKIRYVAERRRDKNGNIQNYYKSFSIDGKAKEVIDGMRELLVTNYNELPARVEKRKTLEGKLKTLEDETAKLAAEKDEAATKYEAATKEFWAKNPDLEKQKGSKRIIFFIWAAVGLVVCVGCNFLNALTVGLVLFVISLIIGACATSSARRKLEQSFFPEEIKTLKAQLDDAEKRHAEKQSELEKQKHENYEFEHEV